MRLLVAIILLFLSNSLFAQDPEQDRLRDDLIQSLLEDVDGEIDLTAIFDRFESLYKNKLNLNTCSEQDLVELYVVPELAVKNLIRHREKFGKLISIYELQGINSWDLELIRKLRPFVTVSEFAGSRDLSVKERIQRMDHEIIWRSRAIIEDQEGYSQDREQSGNQFYKGDRFNHFLRYRSHFQKQFSIGMTAEKDAGEEFFSGSQKQGFDFYSAHLAFGKKGIVEQFVLGDYQVRLGQGLLIWTGFAFGKTPLVSNVKRVSLGVAPYRSVNELSFLRGSAITLQKGPLKLHAFASRKLRDALVADSTELGEFEAVAVSFQESGFHRTQSELDRKGLFEERLGGLALEYNTGRLHLGLNSIYQKFEFPIYPPDRPYRNQDFSGDDLLGLSLDYSYDLRNGIVFGEFAKSYPGKTALNAGIQMALNRFFNLSMLFRDFDPAYASFYANAFRDGSSVQNERGFYTSCEFSINKKVKLSAFADLFSYRWLRYQVSAPSRGNDHFLQLDYKPSRSSQYYIRYRKRTRQRDLSSSDAITEALIDNSRSQFRINAQFGGRSGWRFQSRVEWSIFDGSNGRDNGFLIFQDVKYSRFGFPLSFSTRFALFSTDSYDARIYAYENDVLYFFSVPAYNGLATRFYFNTKVNLTRNLDLWLRYARTDYLDREMVSTGLNESLGNTRSDFRVQLRLKLNE